MMQKATRRSEGYRRWVWAGAAALLLLPAIAMQFTDEVVWTASDFFAAAILLAVPCAIWHLATRLSRNWAYRAAAAVAAVGGLLLSWLTLAVGVIGDEANPANRWCFAVLLIGGLIAIVVRFRAMGLLKAMLAMAAAQLLLGGYAWTIQGIDEAVLLCGLFTVVWLLSAGLFAHAARTTA